MITIKSIERESVSERNATYLIVCLREGHAVEGRVTVHYGKIQLCSRDQSVIQMGFEIADAIVHLVMNKEKGIPIRLPVEFADPK